jgi:hypothetical protein
MIKVAGAVRATNSVQSPSGSVTRSDHFATVESQPVRIRVDIQDSVGKSQPRRRPLSPCRPLLILPVSSASPTSGIDEQLQQFAHGLFSANGLVKGSFGFDPIAITTAILLFDDVTLIRQVGDDAEYIALGDTQCRRDINEPHAGIVGDACERSGMIRKKTPSGHDCYLRPRILEQIC